VPAGGRGVASRGPQLPAPRIHVEGTWYRITRVGSEPFLWTDEPSDGRWQQGSVVRAIYLGDSEATVWAEWYRHTAEAGVPPWRRLPRAIWKVDVDLDEVADLTAEGVLAAHGLLRMDPTRRQWSETQTVGLAYFKDGARALLAPSAARRGGTVLAVFRRGRGHRGVSAVPPPQRFDKLPVIPRGLRT
jgi:RES domain-containing protein